MAPKFTQHVKRLEPGFRLARHVRKRKSADRLGSIDRNQEKRLEEPYRLAQVLQLNLTIKEWAEHLAVEKRPVGVGPAADLDLADTGKIRGDPFANREAGREVRISALQREDRVHLDGASLGGRVLGRPGGRLGPVLALEDEVAVEPG